VKSSVFLFIAITGAWAQTSTTTYATDLNGNRIVTGAASSAGGVVTDLRQSINGKEIPYQQSEEKVLSDNGTTKVIERITRHYNHTGQLATTDRTVIEQTKHGDDLTTRSTLYRGDMNGNMQAAERTTVDKRKQGSSILTDTQIEEPSVNGSFDVSEKRTAIVETTSTGTRETESVMRRAAGGNLYESERVATTETKSEGKTIRSSAYYHPGVNSQMMLSKQEVTTTRTNADGSKTEEIDTFGRASDGKTHNAGDVLPLSERKTVERRTANGATVETVMLQTPSINDPNRLSAPQKVSETICRGVCDK
jgi:hypothetical protein